jgi:ribosome-binding protein aMBF1 (putative translation factor)
MSDFREHLAQSLQDAEFRQVWEDGEAEYQVRRALVRARAEQNMTQQQLSVATGIDQRVISRIETGNTNPTIKTLERLAKGMDKNLKVEFV